MNLRRWAITVTACLIVFAALAGYKTLQIREAIAFGESFPEPSETVEAVTVNLAEISERINTIGEIVSPQSVELRNELEGRLSSVNFLSGERVQKGQILVELDTSEERARLRAAQARAELSRIDLQRIEQLIVKKIVSKEQLDRARAEFQVAAADVEGLQSIIDKKTLTAPFDARAGIHQLEAGEYLDSNTLIARLVGINDFVWVDFQLPVEHALIDLGTEVTVSLSGAGKKLVSGKIIAKDPSVSANSRNLGFRAKFGDELQLPPNTIVNVSIARNLARTLPQVPQTAYRRDQMGAYVYILLPGEQENTYRARRQSIIAGSKQGDMLSILDGLKGGELVATQGSFKLKEKVLVYVKQRPARLATDTSALEQ